MAKPEEQRRPLTLLISLVALLVTSLLGALASRQMAMHYGASTFGVLALATSFAVTIQALTEFGQIQVLQRELVQSEQDESRLLSLAITLRAGIMLISLPVAYLIGWVLYRNTNHAYPVIALMILSVPIASTSQVFFGYFANKFQNRRQAVYQIFQQVVMLAGVSILVAHHRPLWECAAVIVGTSLLALSAMALQVSRAVRLRFTWDRGHAGWFLREAAPIGLSSILLAFYQRADVLLLGIESTTKQVGYYGIVIAVNSFFVMMPTMLTRTFMPLIAHTEQTRWLRALRDLQTYSWALGVGSVVVIEIGASYVVRLFAGPHYGAAVTPLRILCLALLASFIFPCLTSLSVARGIQKRLVRITAVMLVINGLANAAVIPRFGIIGCAWATVSSELVGVAAIVAVISRELRLRPSEYLRPLPAVTAGLVSLGTIWPINKFHPTTFAAFAGGVGLAGIVFLVALTLLAGLPLSVQGIVTRRMRVPGQLRWVGFRDPWIDFTD